MNSIYDKPLVSIYISTYNRCNLLKRAINSVMSQSYENIEVLVCDDGSDDDTKYFMENFVTNHKNVIYLRNETSFGACSARNLGIFNASGIYITGLDDDDEFTFDRIETLINSWDDKYSFICANFTEIYRSGKKNKYFSNGGVFSLSHLLKDNVASNQIFTRTDRLKGIGGFDEKVKRFQDWNTWINLCFKYGDFLRLKSSLYCMHHDAVGYRVSKKINISTALEELYERNKLIYDLVSARIIVSKIKFLRKIFTFKDMCELIKIGEYFKAFKYYFGQYFVDRDY